MLGKDFRIAITGSNGYLGSRLCRYFKERGACAFQLTTKPEAADVSLPAARFSLSEGVAKGFFAENRIDTLIHAAYDFRASSQRDIWSTNVKGSNALFRQARDEGVGRVVFVSTMSAYDGCRSLYGQAKLEIEGSLRKLGLGCAVRPGLIYSTPLEESGGMIGSMLSRVQRGGVLPLIGGGRQQLFLTHQEDLARFIEFLMTHAIDECGSPELDGNRHFITANPRPYTFRRIVELLLEAAKGKQVRFFPVPWRAAWLGLKGLEVLGFNSGFRSDSVLSLAYQQKRPDFSTAPGKFIFRDFEEAIRD